MISVKIGFHYLEQVHCRWYCDNFPNSRFPLSRESLPISVWQRMTGDCGILVLHRHPLHRHSRHHWLLPDIRLHCSPLCLEQVTPSASLTPVPLPLTFLFRSCCFSLWWSWSWSWCRGRRRRRRAGGRGGSWQQVLDLRFYCYENKRWDASLRPSMRLARRLHSSWLLFASSSVVVTIGFLEEQNRGMVSLPLHWYRSRTFSDDLSFVPVESYLKVDQTSTI